MVLRPHKKDLFFHLLTYGFEVFYFKGRMFFLKLTYQENALGKQSEGRIKIDRHVAKE